MFNACTPITEQDVLNFVWTAVGVVGASDQFQNPPAWPLNATCAALTNTTDYLANWGRLSYTVRFCCCRIRQTHGERG